MGSVWTSNLAQGEWLLDGLERALGRPLAGLRVALLGLTFKAGTDDLRESPSLRIGELLIQRGATVAAYDPMALAAGVAQLRDLALGRSAAGVSGSVDAAPSAEDAMRDADAVVVGTEWPEFALLDWDAIAPTMRGRVIADARRIVDAEAADAADFEVLSLGVPVAPAASALAS